MTILDAPVWCRDFILTSIVLWIVTDNRYTDKCEQAHTGARGAGGGACGVTDEIQNRERRK